MVLSVGNGSRGATISSGYRRLVNAARAARRVQRDLRAQWHQTGSKLPFESYSI